MAYVPNSGSVVAFQSDPTKFLGGVQVLGSSPASIATVQRLDLQVQGSTLGLVTHAVIHGLTTGGGGGYVDVKVDPSGALVTALGSVVAFQGAAPWTVNTAGSVVAFPTGNQSVSGTVGASTIGTVPTTQSGTWISSIVNTVPSSVIVGTSIFGQLPAGTAPLGSVAVLQGTLPWAVAGSVAATVTNTNLNVAGSVVAFVSGTVPVNAAGSVVAFQGTSPWAIDTNNRSVIALIQGSVATTAVAVANQSVSGSVGIVGNPSISGTVNIGGTPNVNVAGSVVAFQGTSPWASTNVGSIIALNIGSIISLNIGSIITVSQSSSIIAVPTGNQSVSGSVGIVGNPSVSGTLISLQLAGSVLATSTTVNTTNSSVMLLNSANVIGSVTTLQGTLPWAIAGSVAATIQGTPNVNVAGSVVAFQGTSPWVINGSVSGTIGASLIGLSPVLLKNSAGGAGPDVLSGGLDSQTNSTNQMMVGSFGYVYNGTNWDRLRGNSSIGALVNTGAGSVIAILQSSSIISVGTNSASIYGMRNDTVASFLGADLTIRPVVVDSAGRQVVKPFASEDSTIISYVGSVVSGSVTLIQASAVGKKNYITDFWLSNTGAATTLVTFQGGDTSLVGQFIAPTGGGLVATGLNIPLKTNVSQDLAFKSSVMTSILYLTLKGYQAP